MSYPAILAITHQTGNIYHQWEDIVRLARHYIYVSSESDIITRRICAWFLSGSRGLVGEFGANYDYIEIQDKLQKRTE